MHASNSHFKYPQIWEHMEANNFKVIITSYILPPVRPQFCIVEVSKSFIIDCVEHLMKCLRGYSLTQVKWIAWI